MARRKVKFDFIPDAIKGKKLSSADKKRVARSAGDFLKQQILDYTSRERSPVTGSKFVKLSSDYAKRKKDQVGNSDANLRLDEKMLPALKVENLKGNKIRVTVSDKEMGKADGHNNHSGASQLPRRPFIPDEKKGEHYLKKIQNGMDQIINRIIKKDDK